MYEPSLRIPLMVQWPGVARAGHVPAAMALNVDWAPTFLEMAGVAVPSDMQGRSLVPLLRGERPADWRRSMYYRYYHEPGHHNTAAHYGVRTETHKLIHYWRKNAWELYDLRSDPNEQRNLIGNAAEAATVAELKAELQKLRKELGDEDQFTGELPRDGVDQNAESLTRLGTLSVREAIARAKPLK
jgi:arylsulfatase A-like enzyme